MNPLLKTIPLNNGLTLLFRDETRRYFGDFYTVKVDISCEVPLSEKFFGDQSEFLLAVRLLGEKVLHHRLVVQSGVPSTGIERARENIIINFEAHSLPYLSTADFPRKLVLSKFKKAKKAAFGPDHEES